MTKVTIGLDKTLHQEDCEHDWRFSGDIKYCIKCKKGESINWSKDYTLRFKHD